MTLQETGSETDVAPVDYADRHASIRALMRENDLAALLVYGSGASSEVQFLSRWPGSREAYFVLPLQGEPHLFVQLFNHLPNAQTVSIVPTDWGGTDSAGSVAAYLTSLGAAEGRLGLVGSLPYQQYLRLTDYLPQMRLVDASPAWRAARAVRRPDEIDRIRIAAQYTDRAMDALLAALRPGVTEYELAAAIEQSYRPLGGTLGIHFMASMPMDAPTTGVPRQQQSGRRIQKGDVLITEISAGFGGYTGQVHRTYFVGQEPTDVWKRLHDVAVGTYERVEGALHDGATLEDVLDAAEYVHEQGFTIYDDLVHGVNQYPPILKTRRTSHSNPKAFTFRENMVVVIQPNVVPDDAGSVGLQFGETVRITKTGTEPLHHVPRQYFVVPA